MSKFKFIKTPIDGLLIIESMVFLDERGFFIESYNLKEFSENGIDLPFVQDNYSYSHKGILRGLHFQKTHPQGKLVRVIKGKIFDVAVDLRKNSNTFGKWYGLELSDKNKRQFYVPPNFAHGFLSLEDNTVVYYKCTDYYYPDDECGIIWNDSTLNIVWQLENIKKLIISDKDRSLLTFNELFRSL